MTPTTAAPTTATDPFAIGWRDATRTLPDGSTTVEQVPLTLEDALHPQEGDTIVMNTAHNRDWRYLDDAIERRMEADPHALVLGDCKVLWEDGVHHSPDIAVILGVNEVRDYYSQFDVAAEGVRPRLIIEVVSPSTRPNDVATKVGHYHHYKVPLYVIVDRENEDAPPQLIGYQRTPRRYVRMTADDDGRLWLEPLGLYLGIRERRVVLYDGDTDREIGNYATVTAALEAEQARAEEAERQAAAETARADDAERQAAAETARADEEKARADAHAALAAAETARADAAAERVRQLEAELSRRPPGA